MAVLRSITPSIIKGDLCNETTENSYDQREPIFSVAKTFVINESQREQLLTYKEEHSNDAYHINTYNCTTFAAEALKEIGLDLKVNQHFWTFLPVEEYFRQYYNVFLGLSPSALELYLQTYFGYSPADAAEDIKENYDEYVACRTYMLKNGRLVIGYEIMN